jgi:cytidine deaminase
MTSQAETPDRPELVFALVGPAGTRLNDLANALKSQLANFGYRFTDIHLSSLLANVEGSAATPPSPSDRIPHLQANGDRFRQRLNDGAALALAGIAEIRRIRKELTGSPDTPAASQVYIISQLKHPDEVDLLRRVYSSSFSLIAGHAVRDIRKAELAKMMANSEKLIGQENKFEAKAINVIEVDEKQDSDLGQNTRDTYPTADFFVNLNGVGGEFKVARFIDLLFGHPFRTPLPDEYAMYQAAAAALRSSDENRQVGAVIVRLSQSSDHQTSNVDIVATGMNEVPRGGGGFYWDQSSPDARDQFLEAYMQEDRATDIKVSALAELLQRITQQGWLRDDRNSKRPTDLATELLPHLKKTQFLNIGEFSRPVHAEMAAIIDSARRGVAVDGLSMFVTTFPCHNCAKHIIATGIQRVIYLEPYTKSRANVLHREEIVLESQDGAPISGKLVFVAYSGIAPRQYRALFNMSKRAGSKGRKLQEWNAAQKTLAPICVSPMAHLQYLAEERAALEKLPTELYAWDKQTLG